MRKKLGVLIACFLVVSLLSAPVYSEAKPQSWFDYTQAKAAVISYFKAAEEQPLLEASFSLHYPHSFSVSYQTDEGWRRVVSYDNLVQMLGSGKSSYVSGDYWLFRLYRDYIYRLAEFFTLPWEWAERENLAQRVVDRYVNRENEGHIYWMDSQTKLPLLVRCGDKTLVSVANYTFDPDFRDHYSFLELNLNFTGLEPAKVTFLYTGEHWVVERIEIEEAEGRRIIEFSGWEVGQDEIGDLSSLQRLSELITISEAEVELEDWQGVINRNREAVGIDSQYWQGYFFMGYAYSQLDNYLGAVENYEQALMLAPDQPMILNNLAYTYFLQEVNLNQGLEMAEKAVRSERKPTNLDTLGYGYYLVGRYEEARALLEEALSRAEDGELQEIEKHLCLVLEALDKQD
ncbi:MAG: tetratricopeptide repeat protein [Firmicutes bacterium]|nr:tetratricopeptide repeat protein [Bacillota bacterium]